MHQLQGKKCDEQIPACSTCRRNHLVCLVEDPATKRIQPRNYLETLEQRVVYLEGLLGLKDVPESPALPNHQGNLQRDQPARDDNDDGVSDLSSIVGTLSINAAGAEPHYLGSSSVFAFARFIKPSLLHHTIPFTPLDVSGQELSVPEPCLLPDYQTGIKLSNAYFENIHPQYPFLHEPTFRLWEAELNNSFETFSIMDYDPVRRYFLNMVYAVGALLLPEAGCSPEQLYTSAMLSIDAILCHDNLTHIQAILCAAAYSLRSSQGTSHWKLAGQALRQCISLGYHRHQKNRDPTMSKLQLEMQKRAFWSAYSMECSAAVMLGRPLSLHYQEIDAEVRFLTESVNGHGSMSPNSLNHCPIIARAVHGFKIRILFGRIQTSLYMDRTVNSLESRQSRVHALSAELAKWQASTPSPVLPPPPGGALSFFVTPDFYSASYNIALLHIHRLELTDKTNPASDDVFRKCLQAAKNICDSYRRQFFGRCLTYTWGALNDLFSAGLTYLYCLWVSPVMRGESRCDQVSSTCNNCTLVLVVLAERWKECAPFRDIFEDLASRTITMMADSGPRPGEAAVPLAPESSGHLDDLPQMVAAVPDLGFPPGTNLLLDGLMCQLTPQ
ncbi:unnamed protein product, partial [Clonostachys rosea]